MANLPEVAWSGWLVIASSAMVGAATFWAGVRVATTKARLLLGRRQIDRAYVNAPVGLFTAHEDGRIIQSNHLFEMMLDGVPTHHQKNLTTLFDVESSERIANAILSGHADEFHTQVIFFEDPHKLQWFHVRVSPSTDGVAECSLNDVTDQVDAEDRLKFLANHDALTGILNLRGMNSHFANLNHLPASLAYFDLDRFKLINDLYGHGAGDKVLRQVCLRIDSLLSEEDILARVGGDEFIISFKNRESKESLKLCQEIVNLVSLQPYEIGLQSFKLSTSCGLVGHDFDGGIDLKTLVSCADTLCRMSKKEKVHPVTMKNCNDDFFADQKEGLDLIGCLEKGNVPDGLFLVMQPELSLKDPFGSLNFEILLRLKKPDGKILPASIIIESAEAHGKSSIIDRWVINTVVRWIEDNFSRLKNTEFIGVNLSGGSLNDVTFVNELYELFDRSPLAASKICLEITETVALTDMAHMEEFVEKMTFMGSKVSLDDFGAGYSSFGYLKVLAVDALKLDGSLVRDAATNKASVAIITSIAKLVTSLGMKSVGEYAESRELIRALSIAGVDYAQGYAVSPPVSPEQILQATSSADFIEDPMTMAYVRTLNLQKNNSRTHADVASAMAELH